MPKEEEKEAEELVAGGRRLGRSGYGGGTAHTSWCVTCGPK